MPGEVESRAFRAMGTWCHVLVHHDGGAAEVPATIEAMVAGYEARWSRFRATSDVTRVNRSAGTPVAVADDTLLAVATALAARERTGGRFDPTVLRAVEGIGYAVDFDEVAARSAVATAPILAVGPAGAAVDLDLEGGTVTVAAGAALDLGGIGKGLAADLIVGAVLAHRHVAGLLVNLGGDLRAGGRPPTGAGWGIAIDDPMQPGATLGTVALLDGAVATSSTRRRRWCTADGERHHLVDPATGTSAATDVASVTVLTGRAADAEVLATAAAVAGRAAGAELLAVAGVAGLVVTDDGRRWTVGDFDRFER